MEQCKKVNLVFLINTLMPYVVFIILELLKIETIGPLEGFIVSQGVFVLPTIVYLILEKGSLKETLRIRPISISNVILLVLFTFVVTPVISFINVISLLFSDSMITEQVQEVTQRYPLWLGLLVIAVLPAICEETVYRGVFYNQYRKKNPRIAIFLSALLFGLLHRNLNQFAYAFAMGFIFCLMIEATDSIVASMIMHFIMNANSTLIQYLTPRVLDAMVQLDAENANIYEEMSLEVNQALTRSQLLSQIPMLGMIALVAGVLAFIIFRTIAKNADRYEVVKGIFRHREEHVSIRDIVSIPLLIGAAICVYDIVVNLLY